MTLVDDIDGDAAEDKQFIVVKSKGGNYFTLSLTGQPRGKFRPLPKSSRRKRPYGNYRGGTDRTALGCLQLYREMQGGRSKHRLPLVCSVNMDSCTGKGSTPEEPAEQEQPQNGMGGL